MAKRSIKKSAAQEATLFEEPKKPTPTVAVEITKETMERWHKEIAQAGALLALTLARRRRSTTMVQDLHDLLDPLLRELRESL